MQQFTKLAAAALLLFASCSKEEPSQEGGFLEKPLVKGYFKRSTRGHPVGQVGLPNVQLEKNGYQLLTYPNPAVQIIAIRIEKESPQQLTKVFIVPAVSELEVPYYTFSNSTYIQTSRPVAEVESMEGMLHLDVQNLEKGFYRLYVNIGGTLLWDNLLISE